MDPETWIVRLQGKNNQEKWDNLFLEMVTSGADNPSSSPLDPRCVDSAGKKKHLNNK